ncbi:MAG: rhodanese-like domain-containing protein [Rhodospirillales bacterium]
MTRSINAKTLKAMINDGDELALIDVREAGQYGENHMLFAVNAPYSKFEIMIGNLVPRRSVRLVLVDDDGRGDGIAEKAARRAEELGYGDVSVLGGGVKAWNDAGYALFTGVNVPCKAFGEYVEHAYHTPSIKAEELKELFDKGENVVVLDSRPMDEFNRVCLPRGIDCPGAELAYRVHDFAPDPDTLVVVNCAGRTRSIIGAQSLINAGIPNRVVAFENGTMGWRLAGFEPETGQTRTYSGISDEALKIAQDRAARVRERFGIETIGKDQLAKLKSESGTRSLYLLDVRAPDEYRAGHLSGSFMAPGGQVVQGTDQWVGTLRGRIVLIDDTSVRATMTAHWLVQLNMFEVYVLIDGLKGAELEKGYPAPSALGLDGANIEEMTPDQVAAARRSGEVAVLDVGPSMDFRKAHVPSAVWGCRPALKAALAKLPQDIKKCKKIVVTSKDGLAARLAAFDLQSQSGVAVAVLAGGTDAWIAAGKETESSPDTPPDNEAIDYLFWAHDRHQGNKVAMNTYLDWERDLPNQIAEDGDARFWSKPA